MFDAIYLSDHAKISRMDFLSSFGAALGLWAGISTAVIIEIIEVIIRVTLDRRKSAKKPQPEKTRENRRIGTDTTKF